MALSDDEDSSVTSFFASNRKAHKIKFLIEELPTVEHVKLRRPDLYRNWNCPVCNDFPETFSHIWTCSQHRPILASICLNNKKILVDLVKQQSPSFSFSSLDHVTLWSLDYHASYLTFIDLLKGIVPEFLFRTINSFVRNQKLTSQILSIFVNNIYLDCMKLIWLPRCKHMLQKEIHNNINSRTKKRRCPQNTRRITNRHSNLDNLFLDCEGLRDSIYFGGSWLGFMIVDSHVLSFIFVLYLFIFTYLGV